MEQSGGSTSSSERRKSCLPSQPLQSAVDVIRLEINKQTPQRLIRSIQEVLRHASLRVTTDVYMQAVDPQKREAQSNLVKLVRKAAVLEIQPA